MQFCEMKLKLSPLVARVHVKKRYATLRYVLLQIKISSP